MYDSPVSLRMAALGLLAQRPGSGYDLLKTFEKTMANVWPATQSQLYGELNRLADTGLIEMTDIGPRGRKEYRITRAGRAELRRWVTTPRTTRRCAMLRSCAFSCLARSHPSRRASTWLRSQSTPTPRSSGSRSCATPSTGPTATASSSAARHWRRPAPLRDGRRLGPLGRRCTRQTPKAVAEKVWD